MSRCCNIPAAPPGVPKGAMLSHGNLTSAVSIYDVWGKPAQAERGDAIERVICVLPLFHIFALTVICCAASSAAI
jgi:long-chain acyl-CoA synthetase